MTTYNWGRGRIRTRPVSHPAEFTPGTPRQVHTGRLRTRPGSHRPSSHPARFTPGRVLTRPGSHPAGVPGPRSGASLVATLTAPGQVGLPQAGVAPCSVGYARQRFLWGVCYCPRAWPGSHPGETAPGRARQRLLLGLPPFSSCPAGFAPGRGAGFALGRVSCGYSHRLRPGRGRMRPGSHLVHWVTPGCAPGLSCSGCLDARCPVGPPLLIARGRIFISPALAGWLRAATWHQRGTPGAQLPEPRA